MIAKGTSLRNLGALPAPLGNRRLEGQNNQSRVATPCGPTAGSQLRSVRRQLLRVMVLADYRVPGASSVPDVRIVHMETPSPLSEFGMKGVGESGAIGPPAAIANAVNDALRSLGAEIMETPMTPQRILEAIERGKRKQ